MGEIRGFLGRLKRHPAVRNQVYSKDFLYSVGRTVEKRGFEEARLFLWDSHYRGDLESQAVSLLGVLGEMEDVAVFRRNRALSGRVIKGLHHYGR